MTHAVTCDLDEDCSCTPTCTHRLGDRTGLLCTRTDEHETGHTYRASWAPDAIKDEEQDR